jgi:hypothetical protein
LETVEGRLDKSDNRFTQLEASIGRKIDEARAQLDAKIDTVDRKLVETRAHLGVKIEAVDTRVTQVYDAVIALTSHEKQNRKDHQRFDNKLDDHDVRILALEHRARRHRRKGGH